jgi:L-arginine dehydrogenase
VTTTTQDSEQEDTTRNFQGDEAMQDQPQEQGAVNRIALLDADAIATHLDPAGIKAAVARAFCALADGMAVQPPQTLVPLPGDGGDFIVYSAADLASGLIGVKVSPYLLKRGRTHGDPVTAYTLLLSVDDGEPVALCDALTLTAHRTAATSSLAIDHLVGSRTRRLAVIGSGPLARLHVRYELRSRRWDEVAIFSPGLAANPSLLDGWRGEMACDAISVAASAREAVDGADAVMLCTSSGVPVIDVDWLADDVVVTSIATNAFQAHEIDPERLNSFAVHCDLRATAPLQAGEMIIAAREHGWRHEAIIADLPELLSGLRSGTRHGRRFFRSTGLGIADVAAAAYVKDQMLSSLPKAV